MKNNITQKAYILGCKTIAFVELIPTQIECEFEKVRIKHIGKKTVRYIKKYGKLPENF